MNEIATYSFLPWLRQGIANTIADADGDKSVQARASTRVELRIDGSPIAGGATLTQAIAKDVELYGPGDIVGIDERAIVRTEPRDWVTNFESNYLAAIDFYDPDFPWRYTPTAPDSGEHLRLRPWIALVVLAESEFSDGGNMSGRPLPYITVTQPSGVMPAPDELWAWAHVHVNQPLDAPREVVSPDVPTMLTRLQAALTQNADTAYARLLCPRHLQPNTAYHAFVVPVFETGRLAGIGEPTASAPYATASAWEPYSGQPSPGQFPVYYRWQFRTGTQGDFEYLARLMKPKPVDSRVGSRNMDVTNPGSNVPGIADPALGGVLRLGGALQVPPAGLDESALQERQKYEDWDNPYPRPFQRSLAAFVNLADDYNAQPAQSANEQSAIAPEIEGDPDPLVTAPLYARWHALTQRLLTERDGAAAPDDRNWVHNVNLDPRFRVAARFGAAVVEKNAEPYLLDAWQQVGDVLAANALIRRLHLAEAISARWFERHLTPLAEAQPERAFALTDPVQSKVMASPTTISYARGTSLVPPALTSTAMRRALRPRGRLMRLLPFDATVTSGNLLTRINAGAVSAAPATTVPSGLVTVDQVAAAAQPSDAPAPVLAALARYPWLPWALIALGVVLLVVLALLLAPAVGLAIGVVILAALAAAARLLLRWESEDAPALAVQEADETPGTIAHLPDNPTFALSEPGAGLATPTGTTDSATAVRLKQALADSYALLEASAAVGSRPAPTKLDLPTLTGKAVAALDPKFTIAQRGFSKIEIPRWVAAEQLTDYGEVMAYPRIDLPMYEPLKSISIELFLPNINLIPANSVTLVETNQRFIESYMIGLNYELGRKLLWDEYPTDQRGSYFRQFWDVRSAVGPEGLSESAEREALYDIPAINTWLRASKLGEHNNRQSAGEHAEQAVLVLRGELLKKFPTAVIYAQRAEWEYKSGSSAPDLSVPRKLVALTSGEEQNPPSSKVRFPLYDAKADPDIYFFGFDLSVAEAKGGSGDSRKSDPGWFFVIKERPGEPRFGLELTREGALEVLEEVTWREALPGANPGQFLSATSLAHVNLTPSKPPKQAPPPDPEEKRQQNIEDLRANAAPASSARWAYLLLRPPVMVAIHADQMLGSGS